MKIVFTAKELVATITDEHGHTVLDYKAESYAVTADLRALFDAAFKLALHVKAQADEVQS